MASSRKQFQNIALAFACQYGRGPNEYGLRGASLLLSMG